jgi:hypothetical protein
VTLTWLQEIQKYEDTHSGMNCEEDIIEMEMWKCLLKVDTQVEVTYNLYSVLMMCTVERIQGLQKYFLKSLEVIKYFWCVSNN